MLEVLSTGAPPQSGLSVPMSVRYVSKGDTLGVEYMVTNTRAKPIYIFNVLWDFDPAGRRAPAPLPLYSCLRHGKLLHLAKMILPLPESVDVYIRIVPYATKVEPGQVFEGKLQLPLPIAEYNPYFPENPDPKFKLEQSQSAIFTLQFVEELADLKVTPAPLPDALELSHPQLLAHIETLRSNSQPLQVRVNKRQDGFDEF